MNFNMLISKLSEKKNGQFFKMSWCSDVPLTAKAKKEGHIVYKITTGTVRKGIKYGNIASVKARRMEQMEQGIDLSAPKPELPWGQWNPNHKGLIIDHTNKAGKFTQYVRLYNTPNHPTVEYFLDGKHINREDLVKLGIVLPSYWQKGRENAPTECFTVNIANIMTIY